MFVQLRFRFSVVVHATLMMARDVGFTWGASATHFVARSTGFREVEVASLARVSNDVVALQLRRRS